MPAGLEEIKAICARFKKDEFYTFLGGFFLGLVYYLVLVTDSATKPALNFYIKESYYISLFLITSGLFSTLILYLVYLLFCWPFFSHAKSKINIPEGETPKPFPYKQYEDFLASYPHLYGLIAATLILLLPLPWILWGCHELFSSLWIPILVNLLQILCLLLFSISALYPRIKEIAEINLRLEKGIYHFTE